MKIESIQQYQNLAVTTRSYPDDIRISYPALGLLGELGEVQDQILIDEDLGSTDYTRLNSEIGDGMWYIVVLAYDLELDISDFKMGQGIYDTIQDIIPLCLDVAELVKKILRDRDDVERVTKKKGEVKKLLGEIWLGLCGLIRGSSVFEVLEGNIEKLFSRKERGTIKGDGEDR